MGTNPASAPPDIEIRTIRKVRTRITPFIFVLMVIAFLDRINIGFAALTMDKELAITSQQFGFLSGIFFFGYFIFEIPSNLLRKLSWGACLCRGFIVHIGNAANRVAKKNGTACGGRRCDGVVPPGSDANC